MTNEEIANEHRRILAIEDVSSIKDEEEKKYAKVVHALNDTYKSLGYSNSEGNVIETVRRLNG